VNRDAVFLDDNLPDPLPDPLPELATVVVLGGSEGRHAARVRRIRPGETIVVADGRGRGVRGPVRTVDGDRLTVEVADRVTEPEPELRFVVVQALAKGDRSESAVEMLTEIGVSEIVPWQSSRSIVRWGGERGARGRARWQAIAREATKQSRRLRIPRVAEPVDLERLCERVGAAAVTLVLHEIATEPLRAVPLPSAGEVVLIVGPEGGLTDEEVARLIAAGGRAVSLGDGVLRTSTAGVVACGALLLR
jgi:16S rRNA (uracil1498-N3)-methyltransferase